MQVDKDYIEAGSATLHKRYILKELYLPQSELQ